MISQMLLSTDKQLKYNTLLLLVRNKRPVPDTLFTYFAGMDDYRYRLYNDLKRANQLSLFPPSFKNGIAITRSQLVTEQSYNKLDTIVFMEKVPLKYKTRDGYVYVFKYKEKKEDNSWKLATVGLLPNSDTTFRFEDKVSISEEADYNFTDVTTTKLSYETPEKEQVDKLVKRLLYGKRKSAAQFYDEGNQYDNHDFPRLRF
jgi:hypothetical protein